MALDINDKTFVIYIIALAKPTIMLIYPSYESQVTLLTNTEISTKYFDFLDLFFSDSKAELPEYIGTNNYLINLLKDKKPPYGPIYNLG